MKQFLLFLGALALAVIILCVLFTYQNNHIENWSNDNDIQIIEIKNHYTIIGTPYYYSNKAVIYEVVTNDSTYWFRHTLFGWDIETTK